MEPAARVRPRPGDGAARIPGLQRVFVAIDPIAANRWRLGDADAAQSLALVTIVAYLGAGLLVTACSTDPDVAWGGCSIVTLFSLGILLPIWVGLGRVAADQ